MASTNQVLKSEGQQNMNSNAAAGSSAPTVVVLTNTVEEYPDGDSKLPCASKDIQATDKGSRMTDAAPKNVKVAFSQTCEDGSCIGQGDTGTTVTANTESPASTTKLFISRGDMLGLGFPSGNNTSKHFNFQRPVSFLTREGSAATSATQIGQDVLEKIKRKLSQNFMKQVSACMSTQKKESTPDPKATHVPGTNCEYRTPGANYKNKNGRVKRPMNAFMVWARDFRGRLAAAMPNATNSDISVTLGQVWASLPTSEKRPYYETAERIKMKHRQDFPDWVYQPTATQKKDEGPMLKPMGHVTSIVVEPSDADKLKIQEKSASLASATGTSVQMPSSKETNYQNRIVSNGDLKPIANTHVNMAVRDVSQTRIVDVKMEVQPLQHDTSNGDGQHATGNFNVQHATNNVGVQHTCTTSNVGLQNATSNIGLQHATSNDSVQHAIGKVNGQYATSNVGIQRAINNVGVQHATSNVGVTRSDNNNASKLNGERVVLHTPENNRIPVYLQRVNYQPMSHDLPGRNHVSSYTKGMLTNKIVHNRPDIQRRRGDILLTPALQRAIAQQTLTPVSNASPPTKPVLPMADRFNNVRPALAGNVTITPRPSEASRNGSSTTILCRPADILKHVPIFQSHISPIAKLQTARELMGMSSVTPDTLSGTAIKPSALASEKSTILASQCVLDNTSGTSFGTPNVSEGYQSVLPTVTNGNVLLNPKTGHQNPNETLLCDTDEELLDLKKSISEIFNPFLQGRLKGCNLLETDQLSTAAADENDDLWPFPFSQNPDDWDTDCGPESLYMELLDPYDPFLLADRMLSDTFPGSLHLDMDRWNRYLGDDDTDTVDPLSQLIKPEADDFSISPVPLKETLSRLLDCKLQRSETGDVTTGDLLMSASIADDTCEKSQQKSMQSDDVTVSLTVQQAAEITLSLAHELRRDTLDKDGSSKVDSSKDGSSNDVTHANRCVQIDSTERDTLERFTHGNINGSDIDVNNCEDTIKDIVNHVITRVFDTTKTGTFVKPASDNCSSHEHSTLDVRTVTSTDVGSDDVIDKNNNARAFRVQQKASEWNLPKVLESSNNIVVKQRITRSKAKATKL